ncbi:hypothetical protein VPH35_103237 [Triticum aestivum]
MRGRERRKNMRGGRKREERGEGVDGRQERITGRSAAGSSSFTPGEGAGEAGNKDGKHRAVMVRWRCWEEGGGRLHHPQGCSWSCSSMRSTMEQAVVAAHPRPL